MRLIDADALIKTIGSHCYLVRQKINSIEPGMTLTGIMQAIQEQPTIKPERKTGEWNFIGDDMFECTNCGVVYKTNQLNSLRNYDMDPYAPKFCPNCGADMRRTRNEECR